MDINEIRYFQWGDEPAGMVSTWTIDANGTVKLSGMQSHEKALKKKWIMECPFP